MRWPKTRKAEISKKSEVESSLPSSWEKQIKRICKLAPPPPEELIYFYLQAAYRLMRKIGPPSDTKEAALDKMADDLNKPKVQFNRARLIIEQTAASHMKPKMRWKYAVVLLYARKRKIKSEAFIDFVKKEGGINACVKKYGKIKTET